MEMEKEMLENAERIVINHININSMRYKTDCLTIFSKNELDILVILEIKLDSLFPQTQFCMSGFSNPYRVGRNRKEQRRRHFALYKRRGYIPIYTGFT